MIVYIYMIVIYRPIMQESSELCDSIVDCVHTSLSELQSIWDEIGIRDAEAEYSSVLNHVRTMWSDKIGSA